MKRGIALLAAAFVLTGINQAQAQTREQPAGPGVVEATIIPGGATFFTEGKDTQGPSFGSYDLGGSVTVNFNRYIGVEGEISGALGVSQSLDFNGVSSDVKPPHSLSYSGNLVVSAPTKSAVVPYVTGGIGGLNVFERAALGINDTETFLTGNVGGGVKWYAGRWGLRGDYRFIAVQSKDDAPEFFGQETRYGHRIYGGVILNVVR
jgi:Outer membrane protein beta-barrel domain